jgi:hypothetical protein
LKGFRSRIEFKMLVVVDYKTEAIRNEN